MLSPGMMRLHLQLGYKHFTICCTVYVTNEIYTFIVIIRLLSRCICVFIVTFTGVTWSGIKTEKVDSFLSLKIYRPPSFPPVKVNSGVSTKVTLWLLHQQVSSIILYLLITQLFPTICNPSSKSLRMQWFANLLNPYLIHNRSQKTHQKVKKRNFHEKYYLISKLMAATRLKKGTEG